MCKTFKIFVIPDVFKIFHGLAENCAKIASARCGDLAEVLPSTAYVKVDVGGKSWDGGN